MHIVSSILLGIRMALVEMRAHKLRSGLSILGVMLGVASLVAMLTLIGGIDVYLNQKMGKWAGSIWIWKTNNPSDDKNKLAWSQSPGLRFSDGSFLEDKSASVKSFQKEISRRQDVTIAGIQQWASVRGVEPAALERDLEHIAIKRGRWPESDDYRLGKRSAVISWELDKEVRSRKNNGDTTGGPDLVGETMVMQGTPFTIIGIYEPKDPNFSPWNLRRGVVMPLGAMQQYITGMDPDPGSFEVTVSNVRKLRDDAWLATRVLMGKHRGVEDFEYRTADWLEQLNSMLSNVSLLMGLISLVSLLVGGLSIMNVMLSSIAERIREIGVRKALGARNMQLFIQFIAESTTLSCVGGAFGMIVGLVPLLFQAAIRDSTQGVIVPTILPLHALGVGVIIVFVGILFGLYPAIKATMLDPIDALRYE